MQTQEQILNCLLVRNYRRNAMKIIFEGYQTINVDEFSTDEIRELNKIGKDVYIADGNVVIEEKEV